jgi:hypothetical protein
MTLDEYEFVLAATHGSKFHAPARGASRDDRRVRCSVDCEHGWKTRNPDRVTDWREPCKACFEDDAFGATNVTPQDLPEVSD